MTKGVPEKVIQLPKLETISQLSLRHEVSVKDEDVEVVAHAVAAVEGLEEERHMMLGADWNMKHQEVLQAHVAYCKWKAEAGVWRAVPIPPTHTVGVIGLGRVTAQHFVERCAMAGDKLGKALREAEVESACVAIDARYTGVPITQTATWVAFFKALMMALVANDAYKNEKERQKERLSLKRLTVCAPDAPANVVTEMLERARSLAFASRYAAALVDSPPSHCNCQTMTTSLQAMVKDKKKLSIEVLDEQACAKHNMGAFLAVAQGGNWGARLIHITYKNGDGKRKFAFVGKGITFDTGGYSLKQPSQQLTMKCDMAGAASVLSSALAVADLDLPDTEVHFIGMCCANLVDQHAYLVSDVVTASNGKTIEVTNTDAEGRLVLADGLVFAENVMGGPGKGTIVDVATLTGGALVALGPDMAAVMSNKQELANAIQEVSDVTGELTWPIPMREAYMEHLKSKTADIVNVNMGWLNASTMVGGLFLKQFVSKETAWAHVDAAGPMWNGSENAGTGWGVYLITQLLLSQTKN
eukprot:Gregarina_sp_Pseudo_9__4154@NODE_42_length_5251_cov_42_105526_g39_i0_p2_GENE_NODE_42_length_5251_cov_42_105526_g39_i0NODE_42_length_5251_cov_42_105526_g39_i0_p2_ORF_typecomplete_len540_score179_05Peptidase_M17/PF00883_21/4_6e96Peptidase_M17_N/PF02789_17/9_9e03Peptidase_M17_N/PF02789_17/0_0022VitDbind_III/PF09164_10/0_38YCII/PF03795_14/2_2YCII/PF03795_14/1_3e04YCII/PF03795_14/4_9e02YCII/PF03795_14/3_3e02_NODE_42_length_5251_cov_42_105526_g39_i036305213